jgi:hypothetical protein
MSENAAPGSANNTGADSSRGMPYYERLRRDLRESLNKKRLIDNSLVSTPNDALYMPVLTLMAATTRGQHPQSRDSVPGGDERRKHHQGLR